MKPAMDCREARAHAPLFVGEDLDVEAADAVRVHLDACAECAAQVAALERALRAFEFERQRVDPRVDLWAGIERELAQSGHLRLASTTRVAAAAGALAAATPLAGPSAVPQRTLAGARRWFAVAAAAVLAAFVGSAWFLDAPKRPDASGDSGSSASGSIASGSIASGSIASGSIASGSTVVRSSPSTPPAATSSDGRRAPAPQAERTPQAEYAPQAGAAALVADVSNSGDSGARLVAERASAPADGLVSTERLNPRQPVRHEGLRRVSGDEALLRDSLSPWGAQGGYSLVGNPGVR